VLISCTDLIAARVGTKLVCGLRRKVDVTVTSPSGRVDFKVR
jgi:hypothetical protein